MNRRREAAVAKGQEVGAASPAPAQPVVQDQRSWYEGALWMIDHLIEWTEQKLVREYICNDYWLAEFREARTNLIKMARENGVELEEG